MSTIAPFLFLAICLVCGTHPEVKQGVQTSTLCRCLFFRRSGRVNIVIAEHAIVQPLKKEGHHCLACCIHRVSAAAPFFGYSFGFRVACVA